MIVVRELTKTYGNTEALKGISFSVKAGEVIGLLGPNGAGKTTLMKILAGYLQPTSGIAEVGGSQAKDFYRDEEDVFRCDRKPDC